MEVFRVTDGRIDALWNFDNGRLAQAEAKAFLWNLLSWERAFFAESHKFTPNFSVLENRFLKVPPGFRLRTLDASPTSWSAVIVEDSAAIRCAIADAKPNPIDLTAADATPVCQQFASNASAVAHKTLAALDAGDLRRTAANFADRVELHAVGGAPLDSVSVVTRDQLGAMTAPANGRAKPSEALDIVGEFEVGSFSTMWTRSKRDQVRATDIIQVVRVRNGRIDALWDFIGDRAAGISPLFRSPWP
jgi:ketosteroid isomerase-like protein